MKVLPGLHPTSSRVTNDRVPLMITPSISAMLLMHQLQVRTPERTTILTTRPSYWATLATTLHEMAASIVDLEGGYFRDLHEVIVETERALRDVSLIDAHYVSQVVTVMSSWQEAVQTAASHMEGVDTTIYLVCREDVRKATREYVVAVVKAREECDAVHAVEEEARRQALKDDDYGDPVVRLLHITRTVACAQCEKAVDAFLSSIKKTLQKHMPVHAQGPLISNTLSTAFQFQMSVWRMIGKECIHPVRAKHSD